MGTPRACCESPGEVGNRTFPHLRQACQATGRCAQVEITADLLGAPLHAAQAVATPAGRADDLSIEAAAIVADHLLPLQAVRQQ
jgi:hypothetical protein